MFFAPEELDLSDDDERKLQAAICSVRGQRQHPLRSMSDVTAFLSSNDDKDNCSRLICWVAHLGIISPSWRRWASDLLDLQSDYSGLIARHISNPCDPLAEIANDTGRVIRADTQRDVVWLNELADQLAIDSDRRSDFELRCTRVLATMCLSLRGFQYVQGHDRFVCVLYLLGLPFCARFGVNSQFAECCCFF